MSISGFPVSNSKLGTILRHFKRMGYPECFVLPWHPSFAVAILLSVLLLAILIPSTPAQAETIKVKLPESALISIPLLQPERADWVSLEIDSSRVKLMHNWAYF